MSLDTFVSRVRAVAHRSVYSALLLGAFASALAACGVKPQNDVPVMSATAYPSVISAPEVTVAPSGAVASVPTAVPTGLVPTAAQQAVSPTSTPVLPEASTPTPVPTSVATPTPTPVVTPTSTPALQTGPDLQAYAIKDRGWDAAVVIGGRQFVSGQPDDGKTYVGVGIANEGNQVARAFKTALYVNGKLVKSWTTDELGTQRYTTGVVSLEDVVRAARIGQGEYLFSVEVDSEKSVAEGNEGNNSFAKTVSVAFSAPDPMVASGSPVSFARAAEVLGGKALRDDPRKYVVVRVENGSGQLSAERVPVELKVDGVVAYSWAVTLKPNEVATVSVEVGDVARRLKILSGDHFFEVFVNSTSSASWVLDQNSENNAYKASLEFKVAPEPVVRPVTSSLVQKLLELEKRGVPVDQRIYDEEISPLYRDFLKKYGFSLDGVNLTTKVMPTLEYAKERAKDYKDPSLESVILSQPLVHFGHNKFTLRSTDMDSTIKIEEGPPASFITTLGRETAPIFYAKQNPSGFTSALSGMTNEQGREYFQELFEVWTAAALIEQGYSTWENISVHTGPIYTQYIDIDTSRVWAAATSEADKRGLPFGSVTSDILFGLYSNFIAQADPVAHVAALNERAKEINLRVYISNRRVNNPETELSDAVRRAVDPLGAIKGPLSLDRVLLDHSGSKAPLLRVDRNF